MNTRRTLLLPDDFVVTLKSHFAQGELVCPIRARCVGASTRATRWCLRTDFAPGRVHSSDESGHRTGIGADSPV